MRDKGLFIVIMLLALSRFHDLGGMEVQGWDEALYAIRARSILQFGDWLDQSVHSAGGLYSAAHPPLYIWLTAFTMRVLGDSGVAIRLWSAIFGALTIFTLYFLPRDRLTGFFAAFTLGTSAFFGFYCRQGQLDVTFTFFIILGIFFYIQHEMKRPGRWLTLTGLAFGLALLCKIIVGLFLPMIIAVYLLFRVMLKEKKACVAFREWLVVFGTGMIIALPWHLYMFWKHGQNFIDYYVYFHIISRSLQGVESNVRTLGPLFFVNQVVVLLSAGTAAAIWKLSRINVRENKLPCLYFIAFLVPFVIFSLSRTQLRTYAIPMLPPLSLLTGYGLRELWQKNRVSRPVLLFTAIFSVWASSQALRDSVRELLHGRRFDPLLFLLGAAIVLIVFLAGRRITGRIYTFLVLGLLFVFSFTSTVEFSRSRIEQVAERFERDGCHRLVYVDEVRLVHNPQISYYFGEIDLGWREGYDFQLIEPDNVHELDLASGAGAEVAGKKGEGGCSYIIISQQFRRPEFKEIENLLRGRAGSEAVMINDRYHVYRLNRQQSFSLSQSGFPLVFCLSAFPVKVAQCNYSFLDRPLP